MPEGHTLHRLARDHRKWFGDQVVSVQSPQGRFADAAAQLDGQRLLDAQAWGKHLFYRFADDRWVHIHLGLYGKFRLHKLPVPEPRGAVRLRVIGRNRGFDLNGPNCCELINATEQAQVVARLGADPLRDDADWQAAAARIGRSRSEIGGLLLNQSVIAGLGNIYRAEILHALRIDPRRPGNSLSKDQRAAIWQLAKRWLKIGVRYNRIITVDAEAAGKPLSKLRADERFMIYKKPYCQRCGGEVAAWEQAARKMYACFGCQA